MMNLVGPATLATTSGAAHASGLAQLLRSAPDARDLGRPRAPARVCPASSWPILRQGPPGVHVHLVESMAKRCRFLDEVVERASTCRPTVHNARAEDLSLAVDIVTARACAPLSQADGVSPGPTWLKRGARAFSSRDKMLSSELTEAARYLGIRGGRAIPALSDARGRIVRIRRLGRAP